MSRVGLPADQKASVSYSVPGDRQVRAVGNRLVRRELDHGTTKAANSIATIANQVLGSASRSRLPLALCQTWYSKSSPSVIETGADASAMRERLLPSVGPR
jgi:hypothetical protein